MIQLNSYIKESISMIISNIQEKISSSVYRQDYVYLSKNRTYSTINDILDSKINIVCNLCDRDGKYNSNIIYIVNDINKDECLIGMKNGLTHKLEDRFLYNILYNTKRKEYSLEVQDEYFEKIEIEI